MKLLLVNWQDRLNPQSGGAEAHIHEVFGRLARRGHSVTLLSSGWAGSQPRELVDDLAVHRAGTRYGFGVAAPLYYRRRLAREPYDLVIEALNKVPVFSPLWTKRPGVLLVHHLFGATAFQEAGFPIAAATWLLERPLARVYRGLPVEAISRSTADDLVRRGLRADDIEVIYPGVDTGFFTPDAVPGRFDEPTFLYLGRLKRYKGVDLIISALAKLRREGLPVHLVVAGKGEYEPQLRRLAESLGISPHVEFTGFVSEDQKRALFRRVWAHIFPSPKEGWGITNLEAAGCGTPTIASDSPGLRESVRNEVSGLLVPHGDVNALASAMRELATNRRRVEQLGQGALDFARSCGWERTADQTERHLLRVVARHSRRE